VRRVVKKYTPTDKKILIDCPFDETVLVTVEPFGDTRTQRQNRFLHGPLLDWWREALFELWGERLTDEGAKYILKRTFDIGVTETIQGKPFFIPASTKDMSKADFMRLYEKMTTFGMNHLGITPPSPDWRYYEGK
jgi:hypothetical protein